MKLKGLDSLAARLPELRSTSGRLKLGGIVLLSFGLTTAYFLITDRIPTWTIDSQIVIFALGFLVLHRAFTQKSSFNERYQQDAYRHAALRFIFPGVTIIIAAIAHIAYMNGPKFPHSVFTSAMQILGGYWLTVGALLWLRTALTFGVDNLAFLYVYHPKEGDLVHTTIYRILRHPVYAGAIRVGLGLALLNAGIYAVSFMFFLPLAFFGWIRLVEEKNLLERLPGYEEYRKSTPAFWVYPQNIPSFFKFLFTGK